jgi:hypothetical protein
MDAQARSPSNTYLEIGTPFGVATVLIKPTVDIEDTTQRPILHFRSVNLVIQKYFMQIYVTDVADMGQI